MVPAPVAQWIRAMGFYPTGRGFESLPGYHIKTQISGMVMLLFGVIRAHGQKVGVRIAGGNSQGNNS